MAEEEQALIVRIFGTDIDGNSKILPGLTKIKGISWTFSNAVCKVLGIDKDRRVSSFSKEEIEKIENFLRDPKLPSFLFNRRKDYDSGEDMMLYGPDLKLRKEFDIKRLKKIRSYKGIRHSLGLPVRGQRTKANFRKNKKKVGSVLAKRKEKLKMKKGGSS